MISYRSRAWSLALLAMFVLLTSRCTAATWQKVGQISGAGYVSCAYFFDQSEGFVGFYGSAAIYRTTDGGFTWRPMATPTTTGTVWMTDIWFRNLTEGWATMYPDRGSGTLWRTTDGGNTWQSTTRTAYASAVRQMPSGLLVADFAGNGVQLSNDLGASFATVTGEPHDGLSFVDDQHGVASGFYTNAEYTSDGGRSWITSVGANEEGWGVFGFAHTSRYILVPENMASQPGSKVFTSSDYGASWSSSFHFPFRMSGDVEGAGRIAYVQTAYPSTNDGLYRTTDFGGTWTSVGGPSNNVDTRFAVTDCGHTVFAFDMSGGVFRSLDIAADIPFVSCSARKDSLGLLDADLCDSLFRLEFLHNPLGYTASVVSLVILDSTLAPYASTSVVLDSTPSLPISLGSDDSIGIKFGWRPHRLRNTAGQDSCLVRAVYRTSTGDYDTVVLTLKLSSNITPAHFLTSAKGIRLDDIEHCSYRDTSVSISNTGCDTLWLTRAVLGINSDWSIFDKNGQPLTLPLAIPVGAVRDFVLRLRPTRQKQYLDTLKLTLRYFERDSNIRLSLLSTGKVTDAFATVNALQFDSLATCVKLDSVVTLPNETCDTIFITEANLTSNDWKLFDLTGKTPMLPIVLPPGASAQLLLRYGPTKLGRVAASLKLRFRYLQFDSTHTIDLVGAGKQYGKLDYAASMDVGRVSVCSLTDTTIAFLNSSCDPIVLDSLIVTSPFVLLDSVALPTTVDAGKTSRFRIRFVPDGKRASSSAAIVKYYVNGGVHFDTITLTGIGTAGQSICSIAAASSPVVFPDRTECDAGDTSAFSLANIGCDTLWIDSVTIDPNPVLHLRGEQTPKTLTGSAQADFQIVLDSLLAGDYDTRVHIYYRASDGTVHDTAFAVHAAIAKGTRTLALDTSRIDLGSQTYCTIHDTMLVYSNIGCMPLTVSGWRMTSSTTGFSVTGFRRVAPVTLLPGESDTLLVFAPKNPGTYSDSVAVTTDADGDKLRYIPITFTLIPNDSVRFNLVLEKDHVVAGESTTVFVYPDRSISGKGLTRIDGTLQYFGDDLTLAKSTASSPYTLTWGSEVWSGRYVSVPFTLESSAPMSLDPAIPILKVNARAFVTDTVDCPLVLTDISLNPEVPDYSRCTLSSTGTTAALTLTRECGDSVLILDLRGEPLLSIERAEPNPVTAATAFAATLSVRSEISATLRIALFNDKGVEVNSSTIEVRSHASAQVKLNCGSLPSGAYYYIVTATTEFGTGQARGAIQVLR